MAEFCPQCGANIAMVGRRHRCIPRFLASIEAKGRPDLTPTESASEDSDGAAVNLQIHVARKGRPRIEDKASTIEAQEPWKALKMSRRTWYRRQTEKRTALLSPEKK